MFCSFRESLVPFNPLFNRNLRSCLSSGFLTARHSSESQEECTPSKYDTCLQRQTTTSRRYDRDGRVVAIMGICAAECFITIILRLAANTALRGSPNYRTQLFIILTSLYLVGFEMCQLCELDRVIGRWSTLQTAIFTVVSLSVLADRWIGQRLGSYFPATGTSQGFPVYWASPN